ncbi:MAG TPA: hypothetical protein VFC63_28740 [Blastocatellia bacterium]|nr:hypothetical protein [Blastocatellia bacterium]
MSSNHKSPGLNASGNHSTPAKQECFIIMPISDHDSYTKGHFGHVYEDIFKPACLNAGYQPVRADQVKETNLIHLDVLQRLLSSPMAICDLSTRNPNVLFELGLRQAFDKPVVLVQEEGTAQIFDIAPLRYTNYRKERIYHEVLEDQAKITRAILDTKDATENKKGINSIVKLLALTEPARIETISDKEKDPLLQLVLAELAQLRSEIRQREISTVTEKSEVYLTSMLEILTRLLKEEHEVTAALQNPNLTLKDLQTCEVKIESTITKIDRALRDSSGTFSQKDLKALKERALLLRHHIVHAMETGDSRVVTLTVAEGS